MVVRAKTPPLYTGKLKEPLPRLSDAGMLALSAHRRRVRDQYEGLFGQKFSLLFQHYGIDSRDQARWEKLATELAFDHVPGLQLAEPEFRGRKREWNLKKRVQLFDDVSALIHKGQSARNACRILAKRSPYKKRPAKSESALAETLLRRYHEIRKVEEERPQLIQAFREMVSEGLI